MKRLAVILSLLVPFSTLANQNPFSDIDETSIYHAPTVYLESKGVVEGYSDGTFKPKQDINRVETLKMIFLGLGKEIDTSSGSTILTESIFPDTEKDAWYNPFLKFAKDKGIVKGYGNGTFKPDQKVTLVEALKIISLSKSLTYPDLTSLDYDYPDVDLNEWYGQYIAYAIENNLITPYLNKVYPNSSMNRGEIANLIYKLDINLQTEEPFAYMDSGTASYYAEDFQGKTTASGDTFDMDSYSAAHMTLPFGTFVEVIDPDNPNRKIVVKINDRGGFDKYGRIIDLSKQAFQDLAPLGQGLQDVDIHEISFNPEAYKTIYKIHEDLPDIFTQTTTLPSIIQEYEYYVLNLNPKEEIEVTLSDPNKSTLLTKTIEANKNHQISMFFRNTGTYELKIGPKSYPLFIFKRLASRKEFTPDISENNYNLRYETEENTVKISWSKASNSKIFLLSFIKEGTFIKDIIIQNSNTIEIAKQTFEDIQGQETALILSERDTFTGFSIDQDAPWQPIAKTMFKIN